MVDRKGEGWEETGAERPGRRSLNPSLLRIWFGRVLKPVGSNLVLPLATSRLRGTS